LIFGVAGGEHEPSKTMGMKVGRTLQEFGLDFAKHLSHGLRHAAWAPYGKGRVVLVGRGETGSERLAWRTSAEYVAL